MHSVEGREFVNHFHKYLELEKQQIIDAYESLEHRHGENYYNETYKSEQ
jgi:predicted cupin superfamily sugar epimerase